MGKPHRKITWEQVKVWIVTQRLVHGRHHIAARVAAMPLGAAKAFIYEASKNPPAWLDNHERWLATPINERY